MNPIDIPSPAAPGTAASGIGNLLSEPVRRPWLRRPMLWVALTLLLAAGGGLWAWWEDRAAQALPQYTTQVAALGDLTLHVSANGTLQPTRSVNIGSELSGTVLKVLVDVNDRVRRGQVMVELDTARLGDQILRSDAAVAVAQAQLVQASTTVGESRATLARFEEVGRLSGGKVPSVAEMAAAQAAVARFDAEATAAGARVRDAQAAQSTDRINLSKASIRAPADGLVLTRSVDPGNAVAASLQAVTLLTVAEDLTRLRLWVYVDEADVGSVSVGQSAVFTVSAYPARRYPARITRVGFGSTITDNVVTYLTYLDVDNTDMSLRPGMTATASILARQRNHVLLVPNAALRFVPSATAAPAKGGITSGLLMGPPRNVRKSAAAGASTATARQVWVLPEGEHPVAMAVNVTPGISDGRMTEITAGELRPGMRVITAQKSGAAP